MTPNSSIRMTGSGRGARRRRWFPALFIIIAALAAAGIAESLRHQSKDTVDSVAIVPSKPMQGCLVLISGAVGANLHIPRGLTVDASGDLLVADSSNNVIRKISADGGVSTIAGNGDSLLVNARIHGSNDSRVCPVISNCTGL
jgi:NHL repeat